jgi:anti-sigma B factor antagonist
VSARFTTRQVGDVTVIDAVGRITLGEGSALLMNLGDVSYIDSSGVGELVYSFTTVTSQQGQFKLLNLSKRVEDLLQITKLYTVFEVHDDETRAVRSFS